jgi:hypothetical protein
MGLFMGNRGRIHNDRQEIGRRTWAVLGWIVCRLDVPGTRRDMMSEGYTELFFLDEAVALAAGHRPCAQCRRPDYERFQAAWEKALGARPRASEMDARLQADRIDTVSKTQKRYEGRLGDLPDGAFVAVDGKAFLVRSSGLFPFEKKRYGDPIPLDNNTMVTVLTPRCTVEILRQGYTTALHPSATAGRHNAT